MKSLKDRWLRGVIVLALSCAVSPAATFVVTNASDTGLGSFRQALLDANSTPGANLVQFNLPGSGVRTLAPLSPLPLITNALTIDGYSQPGSRPNTLVNSNNAVLLVRLDGAYLTNGFPIGLGFTSAGNNTVRGLIIVRFYTGIQLYASSGNTIAGNWIGLDADGVSRGNQGTGVEVTCAVFNRSTGNVIGGVTPADRNVISGNRVGISFTPTSADHNTVQGNFIGTDATGALPRGNLFEGITVQSATNIMIGGTSAGARNVICANGTGVSLLGSTRDLVQGNFIGTDVTGHYALGNTHDGIDVQGCTFTTIGGANAGNLIGNNAGYGILLLGCTTNTVQGNWIGTDPSGAWPLANRNDGIYLQGSTATTIGSAAPGAANVIEFNLGAGVNVSAGQSNRISANSIFDNAGPGILLGLGANQDQSAPALTSVVVAYSSLQLQGTLSSLPSATFTLEFFASPAWDSTGIAEGEIYLGATSLTTDAGGQGAFSLTLPAVVPDNYLITATATDPGGNTSAFSAGAPISAGPAGMTLSVTRSNNLQMVLSWPSAAVGFRLEAAASLRAPVEWSAVTNAVSDNGTFKTCVLPASASANQFFRLKR